MWLEIVLIALSAMTFLPQARPRLRAMQANFICQSCKVCGMTYAPGEETDEKLHTAYHQSLVHGVRFQVSLSTVKAHGGHLLDLNVN